MHVRLDRADRPPQRLRDLRIAQPLHVAELDRLPIARRQGVEPSSPRPRRLARCGRRPPARAAAPRSESADRSSIATLGWTPPPRPVAARRSRRWRPSRPAAAVRGSVPARSAERTIGADERVLGEVLRVGRAPGHAPGDAVHEVLVMGQEERERTVHVGGQALRAVSTHETGNTMRRSSVARAAGPAAPHPSSGLDRRRPTAAAGGGAQPSRKPSASGSRSSRMNAWRPVTKPRPWTLVMTPSRSPSRVVPSIARKERLAGDARVDELVADLGGAQRMPGREQGARARAARRAVHLGIREDRHVADRRVARATVRRRRGVAVDDDRPVDEAERRRRSGGPVHGRGAARP